MTHRETSNRGSKEKAFTMDEAGGYVLCFLTDQGFTFRQQMKS